MLYNYHTHTKRCGHAGGEDREYVEAAINSGIKVLGFSDHSPMIYDPDPGPSVDHRMAVSMFDDYCNSVLSLKEEYKKDIEIHLGVEIEYYPKYFDKTYELLKNHGIEYMILGQHYTGNQSQKCSRYSGADTKDEETFNDYVNTVAEQIATGRFSYVAHPDLINFSGDNSIREAGFRKICEASVKYGVPLEVNVLGIQENRAYPKRDFWKIAGELGVQMIIGIDAHNPRSIISAEQNFLAWEPFLKECGIDVSRETFLDFEGRIKKVLL